MRRFAIVVTIASTAFAVWLISQVSAEPISQSDVAPAAASPSATPSQTPEEKAAEAKFRQRDFDGALQSLKEAVKKNPDLPSAYVILARWFFQVNTPAGARNALERAVMESPEDPDAYVFLAEIAMSDRRVTEARLLFEKANSLLANWKGSEKRRKVMQSEVYGGLAGTDEARNRWVEAQKWLEAWLRLDPKSTAALQQIAQCLLQQKDENGALAKLREAVKIDPEILQPEATLAKFYAQTGQQKMAGKWMVEALKAAPRDLKTRLVAAQWAWENGQYEDAKKQADGAMKLDPKSIDAKMLAGIIALFQKDYPRAELYFEAAHRQSPKAFAASNNLALALAEQKDDAKRQLALDYAEMNVKQNPKMAEAYSTYGWVLYRLGRLEEAEGALRNAASGGSFGAETAYYLARVLADRGGNDATAKQLLEGALKTNGPFAQREDAKALLEKLKK